MKPESSSARKVATLLVTQQTPAGVNAAESVAPVATALQLGLGELARWIGPDGCHALLLRALSRAQQAHPVLAELQIVSNSAPALVGLEESVQRGGVSAVAAGLDTVLVQLFELLGRVIGDDLTIRLVEQITLGDNSGAVQGEDDKSDNV